jgi:hypothetical protein
LVRVLGLPNQAMVSSVARVTASMVVLSVISSFGVQQVYVRALN